MRSGTDCRQVDERGVLPTLPAHLPAPLLGGTRPVAGWALRLLHPAARHNIILLRLLSLLRLRLLLRVASRGGAAACRRRCHRPPAVGPLGGLLTLRHAAPWPAGWRKGR